MATIIFNREIRTWGEWTQYLNEVYEPRSFGHRFLFRGQPNADNGCLNLKPSILRSFEERGCHSAFNRVRLERRATVDFLQDAHLFPELNSEIHGWVSEETRPSGSSDKRPMYPPEVEQKLVSIWATMQHNMAVTRILDWSASPYAALYFAMRESLDKNAAIWCVCERTANQLRRKRFSEDTIRLKDAVHVAYDGKGLGKLYFLDLPIQSKRSMAQQAYMSVSDDISSDHADLLVDLFSERSDQWYLFHVVSIVREVKSQFMRRLMSMNVGGKTLFPDAQGLGMSARELALTHRGHPTEEYAFDGRG